MPIAAPALNEAQMIRDVLLSVEGVERIFVEHAQNSYSVMIVLPDKNRDVEHEVFAREQEIVNTFPESSFDFDMIFRGGRNLQEIVTPRGRELFAR
jgi:hypothetical protein